MAFICWFTWFYSALSDTFSNIPSVSFFSYNIAWVALSFTSFLLAYYAMSKPEVFKKDPVEDKYKGSLLKTSQLDLNEKKLAELMKIAKPFLNPQLTQKSLAADMSLSTKDLSRLINERFEKNFFDFVNCYRVEEFKRLIDQPENNHLTILAIAYEAGFNSKTTFNTAFKKFTGMTPAQYKKDLPKNSSTS